MFLSNSVLIFGITHWDALYLNRFSFSTEFRRRKKKREIKLDQNLAGFRAYKTLVRNKSLREKIKHILTFTPKIVFHFPVFKMLLQWGRNLWIFFLLTSEFKWFEVFKFQEFFWSNLIRSLNSWGNAPNEFHKLHHPFRIYIHKFLIQEQSLYIYASFGMCVIFSQMHRRYISFLKKIAHFL